MKATKLEAALAYADAGFFVLPLHNAIKGKCSCGRRLCRSVGKHPRIWHGVNGATTDAKTIEVWWDEYPDANIGIACGKIEGTTNRLVVLDIDNGYRNTSAGKIKKQGSLELARLEKEFGKLPRKVMQKSGSGLHIFLTVPHDIYPVTRIGGSKDIDVKDKGGYIVAAPSMHHTGNKYSWLSPKDGVFPKISNIPQAPSWLFGLSTYGDTVSMEVIDSFQLAVANSRLDISFYELAEALSFIPNTDEHYDEWIKIGFAIHHQTEGSKKGLKLWKRWSASSVKYDEEYTDDKWETFGSSARRRHLTAAYILMRAKEYGWKQVLQIESRKEE